MTEAANGQLRADIEDFLFREAALLNAWRLGEWLALFSDDARYLVPNVTDDPHAPPESTLYLIADDRYHLGERVKRLGKPTAHAEFPRSRTHRLVSNIRVVERSVDGLRVESCFITHRASQGVVDTYFGRHEYLLVEADGAFLIREKRTILDIDALRPQGRLSIIL
jgi:p-cumate 2,3-dioxygenase beta subunit